jgi:hypothetical protein
VWKREDGKDVGLIQVNYFTPMHREPGLPICLLRILMGFLWFEIGLRSCNIRR